jgi:hypothetical protein
MAMIDSPCCAFGVCPRLPLVCHHDHAIAIPSDTNLTDVSIKDADLSGTKINDVPVCDLIRAYQVSVG